MARSGSLLVLGSLCGALLAAAPSSAQPYYSLQNGSGEQFERGPRPGPVQPATTGGSAMARIGTGTMFPPLLIPKNADPAKALVKQTAGPDPKQLTIPPAALRRRAPGPTLHGVARYEQRVLQVRTNRAFSAPALGSAVLRAGGRTGPPIATFTGPPSTMSGQLPDVIRYAKTAAQFGGRAQTGVVALSPTKVWANAGAMLPCKHWAFGGSDSSCLAVTFRSQPGPLAATGAAVGFVTMTPGLIGSKSGVVVVSVPNTTGLIAMSAQAKCTGCPLTNMATTAGSPWTTGRIQVSQPSGFGGDSVFTITGMDSRVNGVGAISLVSGALSDHRLLGPAAHRGWLRLVVPEPSAALGAVAALGALTLCRALLLVRVSPSRPSPAVRRILPRRP